MRPHAGRGAVAWPVDPRSDVSTALALLYSSMHPLLGNDESAPVRRQVHLLRDGKAAAVAFNAAGYRFNAAQDLIVYPGQLRQSVRVTNWCASPELVC